MKITKTELRKIAGNFLGLLERENLRTTNDLEARLGERFLINEEAQDFVSITLRPSNLSTQAYIISYIRSQSGIPVELKVNPILDYTQVILKAQDSLEGYSQFGFDAFGNIQQNKVLTSSNFSLAREELRELSQIR